MSPLHPTTTVLLNGSIPDAQPEPIAWINDRADGGLSMYTSLGHVDDFAQPQFNEFLAAAIKYLAESGPSN